MHCSAVIQLGAHFLRRLQDCSQSVRTFQRLSKFFSNKLFLQANLQRTKHDSDLNTLTHVRLLCFTLFCSISIPVNCQQSGSLSFISEEQLGSLLFTWTIITSILNKEQFSLWANSSRPEYLYFLLCHGFTACFQVLLKILVRHVEFQLTPQPWPER